MRSTERTASESMKTARSDQHDPQAGEHDLVERGRPALVPVEPDDQGRAPQHDEDEQPLRPRLLEPDVGHDRLAGLAGATPSRSARLWRIQSVTVGRPQSTEGS